ncbi:MAG: GntR family transcriptional regulator [Bacillota bacterium]|nr:GntR family transcriptional regulator [Bacillota bacterium]
MGTTPSFWLHVNPSSGVPLYLQLKEQLKRAIGGGVFRPGDRLPAVRELAVEAVLNPNTVARVYRELETDGYITTQRGIGTFVAADPGPRLSESERERALAAAGGRFLAETAQLGLSAGDAVSYLVRRCGVGAHGSLPGPAKE